MLISSDEKKNIDNELIDWIIQDSDQRQYKRH